MFRIRLSVVGASFTVGWIGGIQVRVWGGGCGAVCIFGK